MKVMRAMVHKVILLLHWICFPLLVVCCVCLRMVPKKIDVGMGPQPLINNVYWARALREFGYSVQTFADEAYHITNEFDLVFNKGFARIYYYLPALSFLRAAAKYKCMYVYFDGGPLRHVPGMRLLEPWLFRISGVKTVVMPYGSDCQVLERTNNKLAATMLCKDYPDHYQKNHGRVTRQLKAWTKGADIVIAAMESIDYMTFWNRIRHCHFAIDTSAITPQYPNPQKEKPIKVLHAPNHKAIKGTEHIVSAIERLQKEGHNVELVLIRGMPNKEVLNQMQNADIVVDQLIMGAYAMFAMEAMAHGKALVGYMREDCVKLYEQLGCILPGEIPIIQAEVDTVYNVLRGLVSEPDCLQNHGKRARDFAEKYHSLHAVGEFYDEINRAVGVLPHGLSKTED